MATLAVFVAAFVGTAAFWWLHFSRYAEAAREAIHGTLASITLTPGGAGLFLAGQAFFKLAISGLIPVGSAIPAIALSAATVAIGVALAAWETLVFRQRASSPNRSPAYARKSRHLRRRQPQ